MSKENDTIPADIACLKVAQIQAALISTKGTHCEVWQSIGTLHRKGGFTALDMVIKWHLIPCCWREVRIFQKEYQILKTGLQEIVPSALFVHTRINGEANLLVLAETVSSWFNIANPANREEAASLLQKAPKACNQLRRFISLAEKLYQTEGKVIDLYGVDNLILDKNHEVRYLDSFEVFFYEDLLHILEQPDHELAQKIKISRQRLEYLQQILPHKPKKMA